jgi:hypothetical protein
MAGHKCDENESICGYNSEEEGLGLKFHGKSFSAAFLMLQQPALAASAQWYI